MDKLERGHQAKALLENQLLRESLNTLDEYYTAAWRSAKTLDAREDCYRYVKLVERLITDLQSIVNTGAIERARLDELEGKKKGIISWPMKA